MASNVEERPQAYHLVMVSFAGIDTAAHVHERLRAEGVLEGCEIEGEAVVSREENGQIHVHEKGSAGIGAVFGTAAAGLVGLVTGPILLPVLLAVGAVTGGIAGHFAGQVIPAEDLRRVAESLRPGTSAWLVIVDTVHAAPVAEALRREGELVVDTAIETEIGNAVREGVLHSVRRV